MFNPELIYIEHESLKDPQTKEILAKYPNAEIKMIESHHIIDELYKNEENVKKFAKIKSSVLVLGTKKSLQARPNCRSTDFIAPSILNGCSMLCAYCYVPRRKGYANPITVFTNIDRIKKYLTGHAKRIGPKNDQSKYFTPENIQTDPVYWTYDIGENNDCSFDAQISTNLKQMVELFKTLPNAKASFATKYINRDLLSYDPQGKTRIRFSLMPAHVSKVVDVRTTPIAQRIAATDDFVNAGYEIHYNFSPIIIYDGWENDYIELFKQIDQTISEKSKQQLKCECIFLTHNEKLHTINEQWHPKAEEQYLWRYKDMPDGTNKYKLPVIQQKKLSQNGMVNLRYKNNIKGPAVKKFKELINKYLPYCEVRYIF
jgi:spore photoproduct lyase family protein